MMACATNAKTATSAKWTGAGQQGRKGSMKISPKDNLKLSAALVYLEFNFPLNTLRFYVRANIIANAKYISGRWYIQRYYLTQWKNKGETWFKAWLRRRFQQELEKNKVNSLKELLGCIAKKDPRKQSKGKKKLYKEKTGRNLTKKEAADKAHVSYNCITQWIRNGLLKANKNGTIDPYQLRMAQENVR